MPLLVPAVLVMILGIFLGIWLSGALVALVLLVYWDGWPRSRRESRANLIVAALWPVLVFVLWALSAAERWRARRQHSR